MPANSSYSPTMIQKKSSLDIMSNIAENLSAIAKDLVEYVKIKTSKTTVSRITDTSKESLSPTPEDKFGGIKKKMKKKKKIPKIGFFGKLAKFGKSILSFFTLAKLKMVFVGLVGMIASIGAAIAIGMSGIGPYLRDKIWPLMKEKLGLVGEWFSGLFAKGGEFISGLMDNVSDFLDPIIEKVSNFISKITGWFGDKFKKVTSFLTGFSLGPPKGQTGTPDSNTVDTENVSSHLTSSKVDDMDAAGDGQAVMKGDPEDIARTRREIKARDKKSNSKSPSLKTNVKNSKFKESSSTSSTPTSSSGGMGDVKAMIKQHEGVRYKPYTVGDPPLWHIGYGHLIGNGKTLPEDFPRSMSKKEVDALFDKDFAHHLKIAAATPGYGQANQTGKAAFIDLAFNMGRWWPGFPKASKALKEGNFSLAANELKDSKYYTQVGKRAKKIVGMISGAGPDDSSGSNQGTTLASNSNSNSIDKRSMSKGGGETSVTSTSIVNNNIVKNDIIQAAKQENTGQLVNRIS